MKIRGHLVVFDITIYLKIMQTKTVSNCCYEVQCTCKYNEAVMAYKDLTMYPPQTLRDRNNRTMNME